MIDDELRRLLSVEPSPDFRVRVRSRVATGQGRAGWGWVPAASVAAAALVVITAGLVYSVATRSDETGPRVLHTGGPFPMTPLVLGVDTFAASSTALSRAEGTRAQRLSRPGTRSRVQIDDVEAAALNRLFATPVSALLTTEDSRSMVSGPPDAIEIPALSIQMLEIGTTPSGDSQ